MVPVKQACFHWEAIGTTSSPSLIASRADWHPLGDEAPRCSGSVVGALWAVTHLLKGCGHLTSVGADRPGPNHVYQRYLVPKSGVIHHDGRK